MFCKNAGTLFLGVGAGRFFYKNPGIRISGFGAGRFFIKIQKFEFLVLIPVGFLYKSEKGKESLFTALKVINRKWKHYIANSTFLNTESQENFVESAYQICLNNNISFSKIYIPEVGDIKNSNDYNRSFYISSATDKNIICLKDFTFLNDSIFWADSLHLSKRGTLLFTQKLLDKNVLKFTSQVMNDSTTKNKQH